MITRAEVALLFEKKAKDMRPDILEKIIMQGANPCQSHLRKNEV